MITDTKSLSSLCRDLASQSYITIDTEFLRDKTYYPRLCLVQMAPPTGAPVAVDPLAPDIDLTPLFDLMADQNVLKVWHAARQDLEIFYQLTGKIPHPIFDTQVAAMVCGYGDSIGYINLVNAICNVHLDKGAQFTAWDRRPLSDKQLKYALNDVTYLREVYEELDRQLEDRGRTHWVKQEMNILESPATYDNPPEEAWQRIKIRSNKPKVLAVLREVAAWREREAQRRDVPRSRVLRDETLADMAVHVPKNAEQLEKVRNMPKDVARGKYSVELLKAVQKGLQTDKKDCPQLPKKRGLLPELKPVAEMLKMLLKIESSENDVASRLIADKDAIEELARDDNADVPALRGWRYEVFGRDALALKHGRLALSLKDGQICKTKV